MGLPTSYTNATMIAYMKTIAPTVTADWDTLQEQVNDLLVLYGVASMDLVTDIKKARSLAAVVVWRRAVNECVLAHDFSADGGSYKLSQQKAALEKRLTAAEADAAAYLEEAALDAGTSDDSIIIGTMTYCDRYTPNAYE